MTRRHVPATITDPDNGPFDFCEFCDYRWPCDASLFRDALDESQAKAAAERRQYGIAMKAMLQSRDAARALSDELGRMLSEACWAIDHTCTQCGERQPAHTPRCPTYLALAKWEASRAK